MSEIVNNTPLPAEWAVTDAERARILTNHFASLDPLALKQYPAKVKRQRVVVERVAALFAPGKTYSEGQMNAILMDVYADTALLRRALIDFGFMARTPDGRQYWLVAGADA